MECTWGDLLGCSPLDLAQIVGGFATLVGVIVAAVAVPMAFSQLREQRRLQAIEIFIETVGDISQTSAELADAFRSFPAAGAEHKRTGRLLTKLAFLVDVIIRSKRDAAEYVSTLDIQGICYQMAVAGEQAEKVLDQYVSEILPTVDPHRWTEAVKSDAISWCWYCIFNLRSSPKAT